MVVLKGIGFRKAVFLHQDSLWTREDGAAQGHMVELMTLKVATWTSSLKFAIEFVFRHEAATKEPIGTCPVVGTAYHSRSVT